MQATRWQPFADMGAELNRLRQDMERVFGRFDSGNGGAGPGYPLLNVWEDSGSLHVEAELPGMDENDIDLTIADGVLILSGEKKEEQERNEKGVRLSERRYGAFERRFALPADANDAKVSATFKKGVLSIMVPKDEKAQDRARKIEIHS